MAASGTHGVTVVLVHGTFLGPWSWDPVVRELAERGVRAEAVLLPSSMVVDGIAGGDLHDDAAARMALFHDCPADRTEQAVTLRAPSNPVVGTQRVRAAAWHAIPVARVRASGDRMPELLAATAARAASAAS